MICECCNEKQATHEVAIPNYDGRGKYRCADCAERARDSHESAEIKPIEKGTA